MPYHLYDAITLKTSAKKAQAIIVSSKLEYEDALEDGIPFQWLRNPEKFDADGTLTLRVMELGEPDESGRRRPVPTDKTETIHVDTLIPSIGEVVDADLLKDAGVEPNSRGWFDTDDKILNIHDGSDFVPVYEPPMDGSSENQAAAGPEAIKAINPNPSSGTYWVIMGAYGPKRVYIDFSIDDGRGYVIWVSQWFASYSSRWPGSTWEYLTGGTGSRGGDTVFNSGYHTDGRLPPEWLDAIPGSVSLSITSLSSTGTTSLGDDSCYDWISMTGATGPVVKNMFDNSPSQNEFSFTAYGNHNSTTRVERTTDLQYRSGHETSGGVHQASRGGSTNGNVCWEFSANFGSDGNHGFTVWGDCNGAYRANSYPCGNARRFILGINW